MLSYHGNSLAQAIQDLFPDIGVDKTKLQDRTRMLLLSLLLPAYFTFFFLLILFSSVLWNREEARRKFFEDYATENGFDPLVPKNWYKQARDKIMAAKVYFFFSNLSATNTLSLLLFFLAFLAFLSCSFLL